MRIPFRRLRLLGLLVGSVMLTLLVGSSAAATPVLFTSTGAEQTYSVPAGASAVTITVVGAPGGHGPSAGSVGGDGAVVTATVPLPPGTTTLYVEVGGAGTSPANGLCQPDGRANAFNGGGQGGHCGGAGGGASDVRLMARSTPLSTTDSRLLVAGGGGGGNDNYPFGCGEPGGTAGDVTVTGAGAGGSSNSPCPLGAAGNGGFAGTQGGIGGAGPLGTGGTGSLGQGGDSAGFQAGGGGGGYWGGGGGASGYPSYRDSAGGAGSSFWISAATGTSMTMNTPSDAPSVSITPVFPACTQTGFLRDGINLTAKQIGGNVTGTLDAAGCDIGVYYDKNSTGSVSAATISNARYFGIVNDGRSNLSVTGSTISNIGNSPFDGSQHGVGILFTTEHALGQPSGNGGGTISGNSLASYQTGGITIRGVGAAATIQNNTVTGSGMVNYIAQNGIQVSFGASAQVTGNTVSGNWYTPKSYVACGLLFYQASGVKQQSNNLLNNEVNLCNAGRGGGIYKP
jgi:hypothetical protein